jgi:decaprenyl-phosphate phosphoribosyltransferase
MRPKQWVKNLLLLAAPIAAGVVLERGNWAPIAVGFASFCLIASGAYFVNDLMDRDSDRRHPKKQHRPIAAGVISVPLAWFCGIALTVSGVLLSAINGTQFLCAAGAYCVYTYLYSFMLKHVETVEIVALSSGFALRAFAGALAVGVSISTWFAVCVYAGAMLMASGKRSAELMNGTSTRKVLAKYTPEFLSTVRTTSVAVALTSYGLWTAGSSASLIMHLSILPFTTAILRYAQLCSAGVADEPEELILSDRILLGAGAVWAALFFASVYWL